jgi:hypothetical protein
MRAARHGQYRKSGEVAFAGTMGWVGGKAINRHDAGLLSDSNQRARNHRLFLQLDHCLIFFTKSDAAG